MSRFERKNHIVFNVSYHLIFVTKYRKQLLTGEHKTKVKKYLLEKSNQLNVKIEKYEVMPDHVHLFIKCSPNIKISNLVKNLKGYSSYMLRRSYKLKNKFKHLWSPSYYCETIGHISEQTIKKYIEDQLKA